MPGRAANAAWPLLAAGLALLAAQQLWLRPLLPVDETRYLSVAWEMWARGDFLVPHLNGEPYSHKPPLLFWLIHGVWAVTGVSETGARLLPFVLSLLALRWTAQLAVRLWPDNRGIAGLVPWLLAGCLFWMHFMTLVQFDLLLVLAALAAWSGVLQALAHPLRGWSMVAVAIGCGALAKGPVILLPVLPAVLLAPWWADRAGRRGWWPWYAGALGALVAGTAIALAWALPAGLAGGEAYREAIFWGQTAGRVVSAFAHRSAWWSYLLWVPLMCLPWLLWPALWRALRGCGPADQGLRFCFAVLVPAFLAFTLISGKQPKYVLPLLPLLALLMARALEGAAVRNDSGAVSLWPVAVPAGLVGALLVALPWWPQRPEWLSLPARVPLSGVLLLVLALVFVRLRLPARAAVRAMVFGTGVASALVYQGTVVALAPAYRMAPVGQRLAQLQSGGHTLAWVGRYHGQFHFVGRLERRIEPLGDARALHAWLLAHPGGYLLAHYREADPPVPVAAERFPYRSGALVLWPAKVLLNAPGQLDALAGNA